MSDLLNSIKLPAEIANLNEKEKIELCCELRKRIIETVSENGGHLASNLGVIELTVAILSAFDPKKDSIIFDVGHQAYAYKILTGRNKKFSTLRTYKGISGFPSRDESICDPFTTGHSSTSISSALGISVANELKRDNAYTVAVIGDGSLTGGLAFEGLNNAGRLKKNFIVILNDNEMAISKNVGSLATYLGYFRTRPGYIKAKKSIETNMEKIPLVGKFTANLIRKVKDGIKEDIYSKNIFTDLGFEYYGPFDGHDVEKLTETLKNAKKIEKPILIHVRTVKGKGFEYAEKNPNIFHGIGRFDINSGEFKKSGDNFSSVFGKKLIDLADKNTEICAVTAAMCEGTGLVEFSQKHAKRFFDVGIAEEHAVTFSAGLASKGMIPFFAVYSTFLQRAYDNLIHDVALQNLKVVIGVDRAGLVGEDGKTHHGMFDAAYLKSVPGAAVYSPSYFDELEIAMERAAFEDKGLVAIRYPRGGEMYKPSYFKASREDYDTVGEGNIAIVTYGRIFSGCAKAMEALKSEGINVKIIKLNKITPIPSKAVDEALKAEKFLFIEEGTKNGSVAESFAMELISKGYGGKMHITAAEKGFVPHGSMQELLKELKMDEESIIETVKNL
ncbi:MAG: 1-deoxy-D-xylulose-5-phosphate synthase [Ruminococcaceae bacterium]|nr:1-deoxy-D-xylulose-5-phosphate synthase [Oscillospiraceae bacterium]